jgi:hypothetical protein
MRAVGEAYLEFARTEPGWFDTAFSAPEHQRPDGSAPGPFERLQAALDNLVAVGTLSSARRPAVEYPIWASVHGLAVLLRGPLRSLTDEERARRESELLAFIGAAIAAQG